MKIDGIFATSKNFSASWTRRIYVSLTLLGHLVMVCPAEHPPPLWLRYPAISPAGDAIVFCYGGDLYRVSEAGGAAVHLTQHQARDFRPVWSHDSKSIAFASDRFGNFDIFVVAREGGPAKRLTFHSADDYPSDFHPDGASVLFSSKRLDAPGAIGFPSRRLPELYQVPTQGGRVKQMLSTPAEDAVFDREGLRMVYHDRKGYENAWRKHHVSSVTRDIWVVDLKTKKHRKITAFPGEDRNPVWGADDDLFYLSEEGGAFNIRKTNLKTANESKSVTSFENHPVRFLTRADNGTLCFSWHGEIYTLKPGEEPKKLSVRILTGDKANAVEFKKLSGGISEFVISPSGKEAAFIERGEVFVTSLEHKTTKRVTNTPEQERSVCFHPNGRRLMYASERGQSWNLYESRMVRDQEKHFYHATQLDEIAILETPAETFQPRYAPDGKRVAFLEERTTLRIIHLDTKAVHTVLAGDLNYSYSDGDQWFDWSPDGQWLLSGILGGGRWVDDIALVPADGKGEVVNLANSGYYEWGGHWAFGGKAMIYYSNREGKRSHGSWGSQEDVYGLFFTKDAYDRFRLSKEEYEELQAEKEDEDKKEEGEKSGEKKKSDPEAGWEPKPVDPVKLEMDGLDDRRVRLTMHSSEMGGAVLSPKGDRLFYLSQFEKGYDLWVHKFYDKETKLLAKFSKEDESRWRPAHELQINQDGSTLLVLSNGKLFKVDPEKGEKKAVEIQAEMRIDHAGERAHMFEHVWRQIKKKFYEPDLHGVDWDFYKKAYAAFLPHINNNHDFAEMLSEMLGELNASHTGSGYRPRDKSGDLTASLGLFFDSNHKGPGVKVAEIMNKSPVVKADSRIAPGVVIEKIDGEVIGENDNPYPLLSRKAGTRTLLSLHDEKADKRWEEVVKPISLGQESELLYQRWIKRCRDLVEKRSAGKVGYIHIRSMNDAGFRKTFNDVIGRNSAKSAIIIDTRFNGGGWLHDELISLFSGKEYFKFYPRKQENLGSAPLFKWSKPSIVVMGEGNYSNAHMFPFAYKAFKIGKLLGMPVPGTGTAVWWEDLIDSSLYFGVPQVGILSNDGKYLENTQLEPDIKIANSPEDVADGRDRQLERAVEEMLKEK